jgi:cell division control protein 6
MEEIERLVKDIEDEISKKESILKENWLKYLDFNYIPKNPKHREKEIKKISIRLIENIKQRSTGNLLIYGNPGTGKTMSFLIAKKITETILSKKGVDHYKIIYITAATPNFPKILSDMCRALGIRAPARGLSLREYLSYIGELSKSYYLHICIDEFDRLLENAKQRKYSEDLLYYLTRTENISATLITNKIDLAKSITDARVLSSLDTMNAIFFRAYTKDQCRDILLERIKLAFREGVFTDDAIDVLAEHVAEEGGDIRNGLSILKFCGTYAVEHGICQIDGKLMGELIWRHDIQKDGELLIETLTYSDKIILVALYSLLLETKKNFAYSGDVFARQDYYRKLLDKLSISRQSFSVYLTRLSTTGIIEVRKVWKSKKDGPRSYIYLKYPIDAVRYMLENDPSLSSLAKYVLEQ